MNEVHHENFWSVAGSEAARRFHLRSLHGPSPDSFAPKAVSTLRSATALPDFCMSNGLNIAFFASSLVSAYWNGAATYYRGIIRALHERGHRITFYEPDAYDRQKHRDIPDPDWARVVVYPADKEKGVMR